MPALGRPRVPAGRKRLNIGMRVTLEMREAIEAEAARTGRSMSEVIELWLEQARVLHKLRVTHPGGCSDPGAKKKGADGAPDLQTHFPGF